MVQKFYLMLVGLLLSFCVLQAQANQDLKLAQQFYNKGEYEKAKPLFESLFNQNQANSSFYAYYFKCLVKLKNFEEAEKAIQKYGKKSRKKDDPNLLVDQGFLLRAQLDDDGAEEKYAKAVSKLKGSTNDVRRLANAFNQIEEYKYTIQVYEQGKKLTNDEFGFAYELALAHKKSGNQPEMIKNYLDLLEIEPNREQTVKNEFSRFLGYEKHRDELQSQLYKRIQKGDSNLIHTQMLVWLFIQEKDYESAFLQVKALDKRLNENGLRVFELAQSALIDRQFGASIDAYEYVITKGKMSSLYEPARIGVVNAKMQQLKFDGKYERADLEELEQDYLSILEEFGRTPATAVTMRDLSNLYAFHLHDLDKGIEILEEIVAMPSASKKLRARSKLDLGDFYVMKDDVWEATLYYSQVDKSFKDDILGEEARFRNAKLSYYTGDFSWSQAQLDILKVSTSELISNDALDLSIFIMDNMGLDTSEAAMFMFAESDLLIFQNRIDEAFAKLDVLDSTFPGHALADDILFARGRIEKQQRDYLKAVEYFEKVLTDFGTDLLADDALFALAEIYEDHLDQQELAMEYYQTIIVDHPSSLFTVEARKRFRRLRGDRIN